MARWGIRRLTHRLGGTTIAAAALVAAVGLARAGERASTTAKPVVERGRTAPATNLDRLPVLDWSLWSVAKYYVEPERVDPTRVTLSALEALEAEIPEVLVSASDDARQVQVRVATAERRFELQVDGLWEVALRLREIFAFVIAHAGLDAEQRRAAEFALVDGVLQTLDPHTRLLRPEALEEMNQSTKGSFGGLGIEVGLRDDLVTILRVLDGTPAQSAGLIAGDRIVQVDEDSTVALSLSDAVALLKGPPDTDVVVFVRRKGHTEPLRFELTRAIITLDSVSADLLPYTKEGEEEVRWVGLVQINRTFARTTGQELRQELERLEAAGVEGLVLDMRQNPGGLLDAAVEVADAFLPGGTIVSTVGSTDLRKVEGARPGNDFPDLPIVVLVDEGSASATEIVAGALRNHDRALIVGRRTFGKGSVQVLYDRRIDDRALGLKLTRAQYLTPGEVSIQSVGVSPDLETVPVVIGSNYAAFFGRRRFDLVREETLSQHLDHDKAATQEVTAGPLYYLQQGSIASKSAAVDDQWQGLEEDARRRAEFLLGDPELRLARDLVAWAPSPDRALLLEGLPEFAADWAQKEEARIVASLAERDVDWSPRPAGSDDDARLQLQIESTGSEDSVMAGEKLTLKVRVTNLGSTDAYRVHAITDSDYGYYDERELLFGRIPAGKSVEQVLEFAAATHEITRRDRVDLRLEAAGGFSLAEGSQSAIELGVRGRPRPNFAFAWRLVDDASAGSDFRGDGDGVLERGERAQLRIFVRNRGEGDSLETMVRIRSNPRSPLFFDDGRASLGRLESGAEFAANFAVELGAEANQHAETLSVTVSDSKVGEFLARQVELPTGTQGHPAEETLIAPPRVELGPFPVSTAATEVTISGTAQTEGVLRDLFVTVYNPARHPFEGPQKVHYVANPDPDASMDFETSVPLEPGNNLVEVFARGEGEVLGWSRHWVLRTSGLDAVRQAARASRDAP